MTLLRAVSLVAVVCSIVGCSDVQQPGEATSTPPATTPTAATPSQLTDDFLGIRLGQPLTLVECKRESKDRYIYWRHQPTLPCWAHPIGLGASIPTLSTPDPRMTFTIMFGNPNVPPGFEPEATAFAVDGDLVHLELERSSPPSTADYDFSRLVEKYGEPTISDAHGSVWALPSIYILHLPDVGNGVVKASTPAYRARREQEYRHGF